jgi:hypothetical protein
MAARLNLSAKKRSWRMARKLVLTVFAMAAAGGALASSALASTTVPLYMSQGAAFAVLGHSCGGIQEQVYATGFASNGYPIGNVHLQTSCGGSGKGGGYKTTTYTATAGVVWTWFGETRSYSVPGGVLEAMPATDAYGNRVYNTGTSAFLESVDPQLQPPAAPTGVTASVLLNDETNNLQMNVGYTVDPETAVLLTHSTITATPVNSSAPILTVERIPYFSSGTLAPVEPGTTYLVTVTSMDAEGTSQPSTSLEIHSPNSDGEAETGLPPEAGPEFGRCVKVGGGGAYTNSSCTAESTTETGAYNWVRGAVKGGFKTALKPTTLVKLEATNKEKVTCTGESSSGLITGPKTVGNVVIKLTGCGSLAAPCTTAGLAPGELQTSPLEGTLGIISTTEKEGKETVHPGLSLHAAGKAPFLEYTCNASGVAVLNGSVIAPVASGKMTKTATLKYAATAGKQKPESFEGGAREVLVNQLNEQVGLTLASTQTNEEAIEVNPLY